MTIRGMPFLLKDFGMQPGTGRVVAAFRRDYWAHLEIASAGTMIDHHTNRTEHFDALNRIDDVGEMVR